MSASLLKNKMQGYKTLAGVGYDEYIVQKSRFIARAQPVTSAEEAMEVVAQEKAKYPDARHHCYAYILSPAGDTARYFDDGEPTGTAGMPMLSVLRKQNLTDCVVVVTRYFGGILLGAGGLARAYGHSAALAVAAAGIGEMLLSREYICTLDYAYNDKFQHYLNNPNIDFVKVINTEYTDKVTYRLTVKATGEERLIKDITLMLDNKVIILPQNQAYMLW